mgnify:FL=1
MNESTPSMGYVVEVSNPFEPLRTMRVHHCPVGMTVRGWLEQRQPGFVEFERPTICLFNGQPLLRADWPKRIVGPGDVVCFMPVLSAISAIVAIVIAVVSIAVSVAIALSMPTQGAAGAQSEPVYSIRGQTNDRRLGEPIEVVYGKTRVWPSYASRPYYRYQDNDQYLHVLLCIGQGEYEVHQILIGETDITSFEEVQYEIVPPGSQPTLFRVNVFVSAEVGGQRLYGPNEPNYPTPDGWVGPFAICPPGQQVDRIEVDFVYPKGLGRVDRKGKIKNQTVNYEIAWRTIDDSGNPTGPWITTALTDTMRTVTPQRRTQGWNVTAARYEVRARRTNNYTDDYRYSNELVWDGLRGYAASGEHDYGSVTLLAIRARATANLNDRTQNRISAIVTRKLPVRDSAGNWTAPIATRSAVWAFADVFRAQYGGRLADQFLDWAALEALDAELAARGDTFDGVLRDESTVWQAATIIARAVRAVPLLSGSLITMRRDAPLSVPVTMFSPQNMIEGTFEWQVRLRDPNEPDSLNVEYTDPDTGYKQETVLCSLPGETSDRPENLRLFGVGSRAQAYREGMFALAVRRFRRESITFETGLEGHIPSYGDLVWISHDVPRWEQSFWVVDAREVSPGVYLVKASEPLVEESAPSRVVLRGRRGEVLGPYDAVVQSDPTMLLVTIGGAFDWLLGGDTEPVMGLFGPVSSQRLLARVEEITPQGSERVKLRVVPYDARVHQYDGLTVPPLVKPASEGLNPDAPTVTNLRLSQVESEEPMIQASWSAASGAVRYLVETSTDGVHWVRAAETWNTGVVLRVEFGLVYVRVAAVGNGQGPWIQGSIEVGMAFGLHVITPWTGLSWDVGWWPLFNVSKYRVRVFDNSGSAPVLKREIDVTADHFEYNYTLAQSDGNVVRYHRIGVDGLIEEEPGYYVPNGYPRYLDLVNPIPTPPGSIAVQHDEDSSGAPILRFTWTVPAEDDLHRVRLWLSDVDGFDPNTTTPVWSYTASNPGHAGIPTGVTWPQLMVAGNVVPDQYARVGLFDVWGDENGANVSAQLEVSPPWILVDGQWGPGRRWDDTSQWRDA